MEYGILDKIQMGIQHMNASDSRLVMYIMTGRFNNI